MGFMNVLVPAAAGAGGTFALNHLVPENKNPQAGNGFVKDRDLLQNVGVAGGGAALGGFLRTHDLPPNATRAEKAKEFMIGGGSGLAAGLTTNLEMSAIQGEGGGAKAAIFGGLSGLAQSFMKKDGPGPISSMFRGAATGFLANQAHDKLTEKGYGRIADITSTAAVGSVDGGIIGGDKKSAAIGAVLGGGAGWYENHHNNEKVLDAEMSQADREISKSSGAQDMIAAQSSGGLGAQVTPTAPQEPQSQLQALLEQQEQSQQAAAPQVDEPQMT